MNEIERNYYCIHSHEFNLKNINTNSNFVNIYFKINNINNIFKNRIKNEIKKANILEKYKIYLAIIENENYEIFNLLYDKVEKIYSKKWEIDVDFDYYKIYNNNNICSQIKN